MWVLYVALLKRRGEGERGRKLCGRGSRAGKSTPAATDRERVDSEGACQRDGFSVESEHRHRHR